MIDIYKIKQNVSLISLLLCIGLLFSACSNHAASENDSGTNIKDSAITKASTLDYESEMDKDIILSIEITVNEDDWQTLLDNATDKEYVSADVTINGTTIKNVGIRAKGNSSLSSVAKSDSDRYGLKIKFDEYVEDQTWLGLDKLVLNGNYSDATSMKEYLSYDIMSYIGVETPLYAYSDITVNGESWGFYIALEDMDSSYRERVYEGEGELYKPDNEMGGGLDGGGRNMGGGGRGNFSTNGVSLEYTDDNESSYSAIFDNDKTNTDSEDHQRVIIALKNLSTGIDLETYIDVDAVLRYFAAHTVVVNLDSYVSNMAHNYVLYENNGQLTILPWDYNLAFGGFESNSASDVVNFAIETPISGVSMEERPLLSKLLEVPEYLEKYRQYLQEIVDGYFSDGKFEQKVNELNALISEHIKNDPSAFYTYEEYQTAITELKKLGTLRAQSIQGQLDGTIPSTAQGQQGNSSKLVDASSVNLSALGSQVGGGMGGGQGGPPGGNIGRPDGNPPIRENRGE